MVREARSKSSNLKPIKIRTENPRKSKSPNLNVYMVRETRSKRRMKKSLGRGVGSIVWVRRRNGSWWPGKIMALDELSGLHIVSPRTGTPVKLLGREDASVDWYNLEKSKRVKAFRCGDFDESIERAESYLGMRAKKRDKYARREDAILHALELEKELLEKEHGQLTDSVKNKLAVSVRSSRHDKGKLGNGRPDRISVESVSFLNDDKVSFFNVLKEKEGNQQALLKRKLSSYDSNCSHIAVTNGRCNASSFKAVSMSDTNNANSKNLMDTRKRSNERVTKDIHVKRRVRPQPAVQVIQGAANLPASHLLQSDSCTRCLSELVVDQTVDIYQAKRSRYVYSPSEFSDCLGDQESVPNQTGDCVAEGDCGLFKSWKEENPCNSIKDEQSESIDTDEIGTDSDEVTHSLSGSSDTDSEPLEDSKVQGKHKNVENEELDDFTVLSDLHNLRSHIYASANSGVSEWQMRRKRNVRYLTKKPCIESDVKSSSVFNDGTYMEENGYGFHNGLKQLGIIENDFRAKMKSFDLQRCALTSKADTSNLRNRIDHDILDWEDFSIDGGMRTMLIDVELKVQANYKKNVPIVSLMSKIDGKAIIGHPIQIEALKEGGSEIFFATENNFDIEARDNEREMTLPPVWKTARRTAHSRVPRLSQIGQQRNPLSKKPNASGSRKLQKKVSLSSIGLKQKFKHLQNDGLIKTDSVPTALAYIPLKLVFSRLYEAVGRPQH